ncbi:MAG TPA: hypothetical protein VHU44_14580 [Acidobacteriaceae bacterium]|jgi:hypothetical protein|nr:hypothetical protein [Acidobacteriaceae bacterium]
MTKPQAEILFIAALLIGAHSPAAAQQQSNAEPQAIAQSGANPLPLDPNTVNVLKANAAARSATTAEGAPKGMWIQSWSDPQQTFAWKVQAPRAGKYSVDVLVSGAPGSQIEIAGPRNTIKVSIPEGNDHWGNNWNKISVPGWLNLPQRTSTVTVHSPNPAGIATNGFSPDKNHYKGMALMSLELIAASQKKAIEKRIRDYHSSAKWLGDAQYGLMFQWGQWGYPEHGQPKPWPKMIDDFDVEKFADMVQSTGAGYVIWSPVWRTFYFPAPIQSIEQVMPGHTSKRDLIGDLADALNRRGIKFVLYFNGSALTSFRGADPNQVGTDAQFRKKWIAITTEVGERYGNRVAGWFIDEGWYPSPFEEENRALKAGYPGRFVSFNDWIRPRTTDFQDVQMGEGFNGLNNGAGRLFPDGPPVGGDGVYVEGPHKGLQAHGMFVLDGPDWGVWHPDTIIAKPKLTPEQIVEMAKNAKAHHVAISFDILMYEDGSVSPASLDAIKLFGKTIRSDQ